MAPSSKAPPSGSGVKTPSRMLVVPVTAISTSAGGRTKMVTQSCAWRSVKMSRVVRRKWCVVSVVGTSSVTLTLEARPPGISDPPPATGRLLAAPSTSSQV